MQKDNWKVNETMKDVHSFIHLFSTCKSLNSAKQRCLSSETCPFALWACKTLVKVIQLGRDIWDLRKMFSSVILHIAFHSGLFAANSIGKREIPSRMLPWKIMWTKSYQHDQLEDKGRFQSNITSTHLSRNHDFKVLL